jgi:hypothetical protein
MKGWWRRAATLRALGDLALDGLTSPSRPINDAEYTAPQPELAVTRRLATAPPRPDGEPFPGVARLTPPRQRTENA